MSETLDPARSDTAPARDAGMLLVAAGGLAAAFGAASCCALPMLLSAVGMASAWLAAVASFAAPHETMLLGVAVACLAAGGGLLWWRCGAVTCAPGTACRRRPLSTALAASMMSIAAVLALVSFVYL